MAETLRDVMTKNPVQMESSATVEVVARMMRDRDIGDVLVMENRSLCGIVTDRDIVVRVIAEGKDPKTMRIADICSKNVESLPPDAPIKEAVDVMMKRAVRRLPVVEGDRPVGIVSIGDLAVERDSKSALGKISGADPNR
jgi:CBS domain-containing protein